MNIALLQTLTKSEINRHIQLFHLNTLEAGFLLLFFIAGASIEQHIFHIAQ